MGPWLRCRTGCWARLALLENELDDARVIADQVASEVGDPTRSTQDVCDAVMTAAMGGKGTRDVSDWQDDRTVVVFAMRAPQTE